MEKYMLAELRVLWFLLISQIGILTVEIYGEANSVGQRHSIHSIFQRINRFDCKQKAYRREVHRAETLNI